MTAETTGPHSQERLAIVVDDTSIMRLLLRRALEGAGFSVLEGHSGPDALALLRMHRASLVISDLYMPGMDGLEMTRTVRGSATHKFIPIVLLTAELSDGIVRDARAAGVTAWLTKPFKAAELVNLVDSLCPV